MHYLDTSAAVKLVMPEAETHALRRWLRGRRDLVSSSLLVTELLRAAQRHSAFALTRSEDLLARFTIFELGAQDYWAAGLVAPAQLRTLDSLHLVAALRLRPQLDSVVTYDVRLADACRGQGVPVTAPA